MLVRKILATAAVAASIVMAPVTADAKTNVNIGIGIGTPGYIGPPAYVGPPVYIGPPAYRISCARGANMLRYRGYRGVYARDCFGGTYSYIGWARGGRFLIFVDARNGAVVGRRPI
jgi:hypothetical protein